MTLAYSNYDQVHLNFPYAGMNRDIAPHLLPPENAWYLGNLTQDSLGNGLLRYGTELFAQLAAVEDGVIMRSFPFVTTEGREQLLLYVSVFAHDESAQNITLLDNMITVTTQFPDFYLNDTWVKVAYVDVDDNSITQKLRITNVQPILNGVRFIVPDAWFPDQILADSLSYCKGAIYKLEIASKAFTNVYNSVRVDCIPRAVSFVQTLVLCNGLDPLLQWDGTTMTIVSEWVKETKATGFSVNNNVLTFTCPLASNPAKYLTAQSVFFNNQEVLITNATVTNTIVVLTFGQNIVLPTQVFFKAFPPRCNFLYVAQDRIWGLGQGAAGIGFRSSEEATTVYRTDRPNLVNSWTNEQSQEWESFDLSSKHGVVDNLEAIAQAGSRLVFIGREKTQVYGGLVENNTFSWQSTVSSGAIHGDLVFELANDIFFINAAGLHSFTTLNIANQFAATSITSVNSLLKEHVINALQSNTSYRASLTFIYNLGAFLGIRIGKSPLIHALFSTQPYFFSVFSGDFDDAHIVSLGSRLYLVKDLGVLFYGDGRDGTPKVYNDRGVPIVGSWTQPFNQTQRNLFFSYRASCLADYSNPFVEEAEDGIFLDVYNDRPQTTSVRAKALLQPRKDVLKGIVNDIEFGGRFKTLSREMKTRGAESWLYLSVISSNSFVVIKKIILYGRRDR